jgi:DNA-binding transcriptional LysR family regulator
MASVCMDIELAKTFLAVYETGTFNRAAEILNVTQSTVSTRILNLEQQLGRALFSRSRTGTELTDAGRQFYRHASNLVRVWQQARQELFLPDHIRDLLVVGTQYSLWDELIGPWLQLARNANPSVALRVEIGNPPELTQQLKDGTLDFAVMFMPQNRADLVIERLMDERLELVTSDSRSFGPMSEKYILVDWGSDFQSEHAITYPDAPFPALSISHGVLALNHILETGGSGYFPQRLVRRHIKRGRLHAVKGAPWFLRPVYMVYPSERSEEEYFVSAIGELRTLAAQIQSG